MPKKKSDCPYKICVNGWLEKHGPELEIMFCPHCQPERLSK